MFTLIFFKVEKILSSFPFETGNVKKSCASVKTFDKSEALEQ
jgi:hypothetical protein